MEQVHGNFIYWLITMYKHGASAWKLPTIKIDLFKLSVH